MKRISNVRIPTAILMLVLSACSGGDPTDAPLVRDGPLAVQTDVPQTDSGKEMVNGILPVVNLPAERMAESLENEGYAGNVTIEGIGSGAGFEQFCVTGETDNSNTSRTVEDSGRESCAATGRDPIEFRFGTDALYNQITRQLIAWAGENPAAIDVANYLM